MNHCPENYGTNLMVNGESIAYGTHVLWKLTHSGAKQLINKKEKQRRGETKETIPTNLTTEKFIVQKCVVHDLNPTARISFR